MMTQKGAVVLLLLTMFGGFVAQARVNPRPLDPTGYLNQAHAILTQSEKALEKNRTEFLAKNNLVEKKPKPSIAKRVLKTVGIAGLVAAGVIALQDNKANREKNGNMLTKPTKAGTAYNLKANRAPTLNENYVPVDLLDPNDDKTERTLYERGLKHVPACLYGVCGTGLAAADSMQSLYYTMHALLVDPFYSERDILRWSKDASLSHNLQHALNFDDTVALLRDMRNRGLKVGEGAKVTVYDYLSHLLLALKDVNEAVFHGSTYERVLAEDQRRKRIASEISNLRQEITESATQNGEASGSTNLNESYQDAPEGQSQESPTEQSQLLFPGPDGHGSTSLTPSTSAGSSPHRGRRRESVRPSDESDIELFNLSDLE